MRWLIVSALRCTFECGGVEAGSVITGQKDARTRSVDGGRAMPGMKVQCCLSSDEDFYASARCQLGRFCLIALLAQVQPVRGQIVCGAGNKCHQSGLSMALAAVEYKLCGAIGQGK